MTTKAEMIGNVREAIEDIGSKITMWQGIHESALSAEGACNDLGHHNAALMYAEFAVECEQNITLLEGLKGSAESLLERLEGIDS
jgi:hypothetical protein